MWIGIWFLLTLNVKKKKMSFSGWYCWWCEIICKDCWSIESKRSLQNLCDGNTWTAFFRCPKTHWWFPYWWSKWCLSFLASIFMRTPNIYTYLTALILEHWRYFWCNGSHCREWTWQPKFKTWTRLFAFHVVLILFGKTGVPVVGG